MTDKLTDSEIVKAFECCLNNNNCGVCPLRNVDCRKKLISDASDLISRLQAENEKLSKVEHFADKTIATLQAENERLEKGNLKEAMKFNSKTIANVKTEAYKEFAERLKEDFKNSTLWGLVSFDRIDNLLKEMVGENNSECGIRKGAIIMREILFRGKSTNGYWIYGNLNFYPDINRTFIRKNNKELLPSFQTSLEEEVSKNTVGQYTGLTDKNGTKIFEGDIVVTNINGNNTVCKVAWADNVAQFQLWQFDTIPKTPTALNLGNYDCENIGNIHDNPELLGGDNNEE